MPSRKARFCPQCCPAGESQKGSRGPTRFVGFPGGIAAIGHATASFSFDNETPRHDVLLRPFALADRLVHNADWLAFMQDGGYRTPTLWMSDGWARAQELDWTAPGYWQSGSDGWSQMGPGGPVLVDPNAPGSGM